MKKAVKLSSMAAQGDEGQSTSKSRNFHFHNSSSDESDNESVERTTFSVFASEEEALEISEWGGGCKPSRAREEEKERESTKKVKADTQEWKRCTAAKGALSRSLSALNNLVLGNLIDTGQTGRPDFKYAGTRFLAHGSRLLFSLFSLSLSLSISLSSLRSRSPCIYANERVFTRLTSSVLRTYLEEKRRRYFEYTSESEFLRLSLNAWHGQRNGN